LPNIAEDQKAIWLFPRQLAEKRNLIPAAAFVLIGTASAVGSDPPAARYFRGTMAFTAFNRAMPGAATSAAIAAAPLALYGIGILRKDSKMTKTALLAAEGVTDAEIVTEVFRPAVSCWRPSSLPPNGNFADTFAEGGNASRRLTTVFPRDTRSRRSPSLP
jgi:hypothetical protein